VGYYSKYVQGYKSLESLVEDNCGVKNGSIEDLEGENPDATFHMDANVESLLEYFEDVGFSDSDVEKLLKARYGNYLELYYLEKEDMYLMEHGTR